MFSSIPTSLSLSFRSPRTVTAIAIGTAAVAGVTLYALLRRRPSAEEIERDRRDLLAAAGRITDGSITDAPLGQDDANEPSESPRVIVYNYRIAGVTYECAQDVTLLAEHVRDVRADLPVQVRYDPHNPGNSIVVAESWSGLRLAAYHPIEPEARDQPQTDTDQHG